MLNKQLLLFDNVQFREFKFMEEPEDVETLKRELAYFKLIKEVKR